MDDRDEMEGRVRRRCYEHGFADGIEKGREDPVAAEERVVELKEKLDRACEAHETAKVAWAKAKEDYIDIQKMQAKQIDYLRGDNKILQEQNLILQDERKNLQALYESACQELRFLKYETAGGMRR